MPARDRFVRGMERTWEIEDRSPACLTHGGANLTNIYLTPDDRVHFVDWQFVSRSDRARDVAFFLIGALDVPIDGSTSRTSCASTSTCARRRAVRCPTGTRPGGATASTPCMG